MVRCSAPDWDDLLAYTAPKTVSVRHKWVGIVYYVTLIAIVGYLLRCLLRKRIGNRARRR